MTTKPTSDAPWATDNLYVGGPEAGTPTKVAPTAGRQAEGWEPASKPPAQYFNWWQNRVGDWTTFLDEFFTAAGTAAGSTSLQALTEASIEPIHNNRDWQGGLRSLVDHNGYRMGQISEWDEHWKIKTAPSDVDTTTTDGSTDPEGWTYIETFATSSTREYKDPTATLPMRHVEFATNPGNLSACQLQSEAIAYNNSDIIYVQEWNLETNIVTGSTDFIITVGVVGAAFNDSAFFRYDVAGSGANWRARIDGVDTDTGVVVTDNTNYRMRIEILGANQHSGSDFLARFFIDGVLVHSATYTIAAGLIRPAFSMALADLIFATPLGFSVGRVRAVWNHLLTQDAL